MKKSFINKIICLVIGLSFSSMASADGISLLVGLTQWEEVCGVQLLAASEGSVALRPLSHHQTEFPGLIVVEFVSADTLGGQNEVGDKVQLKLNDPQNWLAGASEYHIEWVHGGHVHTESCYNLNLIQ